jgi:hypothetical protein
MTEIKSAYCAVRTGSLSKAIFYSYLTLSLLISYIYGAPCKARNFNVVYIYIYIYIYMDLRMETLKAVYFYLLQNVSTLNQCRKFSCVTFLCKDFSSYQDYPNYRWDLIW